MIEQLPEPETLDSYMLGDRSLADWHHWLTHNRETGEDQGHLATPCSRYGRISRECAWWAIAAQIIVTETAGADDMEAELDEAMGYVVDDSFHVGWLVVEYWDTFPEALQEELAGPIDPEDFPWGSQESSGE